MILARPEGLSPARRLAVPALCLAALCGAAVGQERPAKPTVRASSTPSGYTIGPGDVLRIVVWKEPDLTFDATVRIDGMITAPLVGDLQAAGRPPSQVAESLTKGLERFIQTPRVTVVVSQANSARFYVVGQVIRPGEFPLSSHTTFLQGLALAGGFKEFAKTESVVIIRQDQTVLAVNYKRIADGKDVSQNVALAPGDTIVVP